MSSAALQTTPYQVATATVPGLNTPNNIRDSPSSRQYQQSPVSASRDAISQITPQIGPDSPSTSKRAARNQSGNGASNGQVYSQTTSPIGSRTGLPSSPRPSAADNERRERGEQNHQPQQQQHQQRRQVMPAPIPPRASSQQQSSSSSTARRPVPSTAAEQHPSYTSRHDPASPSDYQDSNNSPRDRRHRNDYAAGPTTSQRASSRHRESRNAAAPRGPSRDVEEILRSVSISQPEEDFGRAEERVEQSRPHTIGNLDADAKPTPIVPPSTASQHDEPQQRSRSRHDHSVKREKHTKFGEYILGNTIGEGEFGKVKLGWKQEGGVQVAIKLIKKDQVGSNPTRMAKIRREVAILKQLSHPNIVRLHKMEESERHYGIILEYASGGELFDYILNQRYLKDGAARRLFAQLVSGVGYLHKKGIVHRDLKLENLLLDRNRNIIVTDFGFANKFDPNDDLTAEEESGLLDRDFVKRRHLNEVKADGSRKGDLMQTSCGSPCYAAPELVVSDCLYTGRKVDVWSLGVILYAMLAGYLPFDDDPANPEGDNINLLYKYIVNTPLTFPEYVTPHARDLLRRILVPNPRRRADLFEVARHSWLSEYSHVVEFITSSTTSPGEVQDTNIPIEDIDGPLLGRSASVREQTKRAAPQPVVGGLASKQGNLDQEVDAAAQARQQKDAKRRTVQVEYVAPITQTQRGEPQGLDGTSGRSRARSSSRGATTAAEKPLPRDPPVVKDGYGKPSSRHPPSSHRNNNNNASSSAPTRPNREGVRATSEHAVLTATAGNAGRPTTGGSMASGKLGARQNSYGQAAAPAVADAYAQGRIQQPSGLSSSNNNPAYDEQNIDPEQANADGAYKFGQISQTSQNGSGKGHRRSNTLGELGGKIFGRNSNLFGGGRKKDEQYQGQEEKSKKYPPVSMTQPLPVNNPVGNERPGRPSMDSHRSRRSFSIGLGKKASGSMTDSHTSQEKKNRRFSLLPNSFSLKAIGIGKSDDEDRSQQSRSETPTERTRRETTGTGSQQDQYVDQRINRDPVNASALDGMFAQLDAPPRTAPTHSSSRFEPQQQQQQRHSSANYDRRPNAIPQYLQTQSQTMSNLPTSSSEASFDDFQGRAPPRQRQQSSSQLASQQTSQAPAPPPIQNQVYQESGSQYGYSQDYSDGGGGGGAVRRDARTNSRGVLQKNKRFVDAYDTDENSSRPHDHAGSSGAARRVMDFFRRRGKARGGEA